MTRADESHGQRRVFFLIMPQGLRQLFIGNVWVASCDLFKSTTAAAGGIIILIHAAYRVVVLVVVIAMLRCCVG